jgi:hypothetical protein
MLLNIAALPGRSAAKTSIFKMIVIAFPSEMDAGSRL